MLSPWKQTYDKPRQCIKKQRQHFATKALIVKTMVFPVVMYTCESWTLKKAEWQRIDTFGWWCRRRLLSVPRTTERSNQSVLRKISPEYSLEGLMLKLKLQYFGHLMWIANSLEWPWWWHLLYFTLLFLTFQSTLIVHACPLCGAIQD